ncbi:hypothetical protein DL96DRAFT_526175 [Flagelloscypha sp. PMI_526]|nr:hypothetical protein DL96DRAFT_526175 [Flagelloscypha sp. PMI_526]
MSQSLSTVTSTFTTRTPAVFHSSSTTTPLSTNTRVKTVSIGFPTAEPTSDLPSISASPTASIGFPNVNSFNDPNRQGGPSKEDPIIPGESSGSSDSSSSNPTTEILSNGITSSAFGSSSPTLSALLGLQTPPTISSSDLNTPEPEASIPSLSNGLRSQRHVLSAVLCAFIGNLLLHVAVD